MEGADWIGWVADVEHMGVNVWSNSFNAGEYLLFDSAGLISIFRCIIRESRKIEESSMQRLEKNLSKENSNVNQYGSKRIRSRASARD